MIQRSNFQIQLLSMMHLQTAENEILGPREIVHSCDKVSL